MTKDTVVHTLVIDHKHGQNVYVYRSQEGALDGLARYCREWWHDVRDGDGEEVPMPENDGDLIAKYFEDMGDVESYGLHECELLD